MANVLTLARRFLRRAAREEDGTATIPFVIFVPFFLVLVMSSLEMGMLMIRHVMQERALDMVVRDLRLGLWSPVNPANAANEMKARICNNAGLIPNCSNALLVELRPVSKSTWAPLGSGPVCVDRAASVQPATTFQTGTSNELMLIRICSVFDPIFPMTGAGFHLPKDATGAYRLVSSTAFVNEPRPGT